MNGLRDAVVFDDELILPEGVDDVAVFGLHGGGDKDDVGLGAQGEGLILRGRGIGGGLRGEDGRAEGEQGDGEEGPHGFKSNRADSTFCDEKNSDGGGTFLLGFWQFWCAERW
jgi:hypothetical protein